MTVGRTAAAAVCALALVPASSACTATSSEAVQRPAPPGTLRVLQANLCDSGIADCYTGRAVTEAAAIIRAEQPDIVTLNEICRGDVSVLARALSDSERRGVVAAAFKAAVQPGSDDPVHCRNGQRYGIGLLARLTPPDRRYTTSSGRYRAQDSGDTEERVWLCLHADARFYACTTHLTNTSPSVALRQCRYLMDTALPALRTSADPLILGADLNLGAGGSSDTQACMPSGVVDTDDDGSQHIVVSAPLTITASRPIDMHGTTDHPGLLADLSGDRRD